MQIHVFSVFPYLIWEEYFVSNWNFPDLFRFASNSHPTWKDTCRNSAMDGRWKNCVITYLSDMLLIITKYAQLNFQLLNVPHRSFTCQNLFFHLICLVWKFWMLTERNLFRGLECNIGFFIWASWIERVWLQKCARMGCPDLNMPIIVLLLITNGLELDLDCEDHNSTSKIFPASVGYYIMMTTS